MPLFSFRPPTPPREPDRELEEAIQDYLAVSQSPLRHTEPGWHALTEATAWERICRAAGIDDVRIQARREETPC